MALEMGQWSVSGTVPVFTVPPGPCAVTMYAPAGVVYTGLSASLTTVNSFSVPTSPVTFTGFPGSQGKQLYATTGSTSSTVAIHYIMSTGS